MTHAEINPNEFKLGDRVLDTADHERGIGKVVGISPDAVDPGGPGDRFTVAFKDATVSNVPGSHLTLTPLIKNQVILVDNIPSCDFCGNEQDNYVPGPYDFRTKQGYWAHGCKDHWLQARASTELGTGNGQLWVTEAQIIGKEES